MKYGLQNLVLNDREDKMDPACAGSS